jgi:hypothetical protein
MRLRVCLVGILGAFAFTKSQKPTKEYGFVLGAFRKAVFS